MRLAKGKRGFFVRPWTEGKRLVLLAIIGINIAVFVAQCCLDAFQPGFVANYLAFSGQGVYDAYSWQFVTAIFLHAGPLHFLSNMLVLYFMGRDVECILGQRHFAYLFLSGATAGELGHLFLMPSSTILYAASGGVAAVLAAYATILPELDVMWRPIPLGGLRVRPKHLALAVVSVAGLLLIIDRSGAVVHSALLGGCGAGWLYAHLLGFGRPSRIQLGLQRRRATNERREQMTAAEFIEEEVDPLLEKISRNGMSSLTRAERRLLAQAREKFLQSSSL
jgi:membrane associated rhomboid family serine protease